MKKSNAAPNWFEEVLKAGERRRDSKAEKFRGVVLNVLAQAADPANATKVVRINGNPALKVGKIANALKSLFGDAGKEQTMYNRSYQCLKSMAPLLKSKGWEFVEYSGCRHLVLVEPEKFS